MTTTAATAESVARAVTGIGGPVGVTVTGAAATATTGTCPVFRFGLAPAGLATRRQLSACGLRPGGADPVACLQWRRGRRFAHLYDVSTAKPKRAMTPAKWAGLAAAMRARRTCPDCGLDAGYVIPTSLGVCVDCHYGPSDTTNDPTTGEERWAA